MVKKKQKNNLFTIKKLLKPAPALTTAQKRELVRRIAVETQIKPIEPAIEVEGISLEEPIGKAPPLKIKSSILKHEDGSILTRNKNIFFKG